MFYGISTIKLLLKINYMFLTDENIWPEIQHISILICTHSFLSITLQGPCSVKGSRLILMLKFPEEPCPEVDPILFCVAHQKQLCIFIVPSL